MACDPACVRGMRVTGQAVDGTAYDILVPCSPTKAHYTEKLEVGYRWYEVNKVKPAFAFGFGLSCEAPTPVLIP